MKNFRKMMPVAVAAAMILSGCGSNPAELFNDVKLVQSYKPQNNFNPIATQKFGADPYAMEYNGRVYVYMTNDVLEYDTTGAVKENSFALVNKIFCVSSEDLVNWTDHGAMPIAGENGAAKWANFSWAPSACHKTIDGKEKFFLYFANSGNGIGVVTSDTPYGPWVDPISKPIIDRNTPTCNTVTWLFDPAVLVDDNGDGYLFVGGGVPMTDKGPQAENPGTARVVKLDASLTALDGDPAQICPPWLFEDAGANKIGDTYYYSYCTNFSNPDGAKNGCIAYMTSKNPMGPYEYQDIFFDNPHTFTGIGGNNHHAICKFGDDYYLFYHTQILRKAMDVKAGGYRCTSVDKVTVSADGKIERVTGTYEGVPQLKDFDPFQLTQAETMAWEAGIETEYAEGSTNLVVNTKAGSWMGLAGVNFGDGAGKFTAKVSSNGLPAAIKICIDKVDGECVGYLSVNSADMTDASVTFDKPVTGKHDLFFVFSGEMKIDTWQFAK